MSEMVTVSGLLLMSIAIGWGRPGWIFMLALLASGLIMFGISSLA